MTIEKRRRGRPVGSCKDDSHLLAQVADILMSDQKLKPTTAIKRVLASPDPSPIRRLQSKWKQDGAVYEKDARIRANQRAADRTKRRAAELESIAMQTVNNGFGPNVSALLQAQLQIRDILESLTSVQAAAKAIQGASMIGEVVQEALRMRKLLAEYGTVWAIQQANEAAQPNLNWLRDTGAGSNFGRLRGTI